MSATPDGVVDAYIHDPWCLAERYPCTACVAELQDRIAAALTLHAPKCRECNLPIAECDGHADWRDEEDRHDPEPECVACPSSCPDGDGEDWPCPTALTLGEVAP